MLEQTKLRAEAQCPKCGFKNDCATAMGRKGRPEPGDFSICVECEAILRFVDPIESGFRVVSDEEWLELPIEQRNMVRGGMEFVRELKKEARELSRRVQSVKEGLEKASTVADMWEAQMHLMPSTISPARQETMRNAFYSGAQAALILLCEDPKRVHALGEECNEYGRKLRQQRDR